LRGETGARVAVSLTWGIVVAVDAYALLRAMQFFVYPDPDPAAIVWTAHAGLFWRMWTASYAGGFAAFVAFLVTGTRLEGSARMLAPALAVAAAALAFQSALLP
jgi:hypothetical protein